LHHTAQDAGVVDEDVNAWDILRDLHRCSLQMDTLESEGILHLNAPLMYRCSHAARQDCNDMQHSTE
jgi:hypothetical protein